MRDHHELRDDQRHDDPVEALGDDPQRAVVFRRVMCLSLSA